MSGEGFGKIFRNINNKKKICVYLMICFSQYPAMIYSGIDDRTFGVFIEVRSPA